MSQDSLLDEILELIPNDLRDVPGSLLYSGQDAWTGTSPVYLMGLNPGGDPAVVTETVASQAAELLRTQPVNYSAYRDEAWAKPLGGLRPKGTAPMQRRILHMLDVLGLDPGTVPSSNLVFARTRRWGDLSPGEQNAWADACWPFHQAMIKRLGVRVVVCFGEPAGRLVRAQTGANELVETFVETNARRWTSYYYKGQGGISVVEARHPSVADWCNPATDVTPLVVNALRS
ncbi:MAG: Tryptophan synthase subunit beta [Marmoricola sp.]|nr:Tryptophan synthase subunit beta [Marmoricola sp.]